MDNFQLRTLKAIGDNSTMWVDQEMFDTIYTFIGEGGLDRSLTKVGPSSY